MAYESIAVPSGKYEFRLHDNGRLEILRYGEPWVGKNPGGFTGSNAVAELFDYCRSLEQRVGKP